MRIALLSTALVLAGPVLAQQAAPRQAPAESEGFFRPTPDIAINRPPPQPPMPVAPPAAEPALVVSDVPQVAVPSLSPEVAERELARAEREHQRAREDALRKPVPPIVSTIEGTAPVLSPLDGTAPIISPVGR